MMVGLSPISIRKVGQISAKLSEVNDINSVKQRYAINFRGRVHDRAISLRDVSLVTGAGELEEAIAEIETLTDAYARSAGRSTSSSTSRRRRIGRWAPRPPPWPGTSPC